jgi:EAL domain-containing protein (putative c-di-GMP-specific phosphodiesterase class I)
LPITVLKIDQDVVRGLPEDDHSAEIASTIMAMSRNLGMEVMAEGIETRGQLDYLRNVGCKYGQGFLIGVPAAADEVVSAMVKTSEFGALIG